MLLSQGFYSIYLLFKKPIKLKWYWNNKLLRSLIFVGFPIYLQTVVTIVFSSIDRLIIAKYLSFEEVGHYSLSTLIKTPVTLLVSTLSIVVFTELNEKYGKKSTPDVVLLHTDIPQKFVSYVLSPLVVIGALTLPWLTAIFLPDYLPGIEAAQLFVFAILFLTLAGFSSNALFILNKQKFAAVSFGFAGILKVIGSYMVLKLGYGISGVAFVTLIAYFIYDTTMIIMVHKIIKKTFRFSDIIKRNIPIIFSFFALFLTVNILYLFELDRYSFKTTLIKIGFWFIFFVPYYFVAQRKLKRLFSMV
jgi:O-antigen/teichoic acid export membrane protein